MPTEEGPQLVICGGRHFGRTARVTHSQVTGVRECRAEGPVNQAMKAYSAADVSRSGYTLLGWALKPDSDTPDFAPGQRIGADFLDLEGNIMTVRNG